MKLIFTYILTLFFVSNIAYSQNIYFPPTNSTNWDTLSPSSLNWCTDSITALYDYLETENSKSFILLKDGKIVLEKYFGTYTMDSSYTWFSAAKSLRAFLIGKAQEEGYLDITDKTSDYLGQNWTSLTTAQEDSITIWHQLTMTSGLDESNFSCVTANCLNYVSTAGSRWSYHNGPYSLLNDLLQSATGVTQNSYTTSRVKTPIGMGGFWISLLGNSSYYSKARDMARYGLLVSNKGIWDTDTLLTDTNYLNQMVSPSQTLNPSYGYLWWLNGQNGYVTTGPPTFVNGPISPNAPMDTYTAAGSQGQFISISPSNGFVMIRQGNTGTSNYTEFGLHDGIWKRIMNLSCTTNSIKESDNNQLTIYPNPTHNLLTINTNKNIHVKVYDIYGQFINQYNSNNLDISTLKAGKYILKIRIEDNIHTQTFIKQ